MKKHDEPHPSIVYANALGISGGSTTHITGLGRRLDR